MPNLAAFVQRIFHPEDLYADGTQGAFFDPSHLWGEKDFLARRNLLTYTEDFSNAIWAKTTLNTGVSYSNVTTAPDGTNTADKLVENGSASTHAAVHGAASVTAGVTYKGSCYVKAAERGFACLQMNPGSNTFAYINLSTGAITSINGSGSFTSENVGIGWWRFTCTILSAITNTASTFNIYIIQTAGTLSYTGDNASGIYVWGAQLSRADTKDQTYQKITDWTTEQYAWAAANPKPWLRRNLLDYNETKTNWLAGNNTFASTTPPYGYSYANTVTAINGNAIHSYRRDTRPVVSGYTYYYSSAVKAGTTNYFQIAFDNACFPDNEYANFDLSSGVVGTKTSNVSSSIESLGSGWYICKAQLTADTSNASSVIAYEGSIDSSSATYKAVSTGGITFLAAGSQCTVGVSTAYQKISTTWDVEYTALAQAAGYPISMYSDRAGTVAISGPDTVCGKMLDRSGRGNHVTAPTDAARPILRLDANHNWYLQFDGSDDALENSAASALNVGAAGNVTVLACVDSTVDSAAGKTIVCMGKPTTSYNYMMRISSSRQIGFSITGGVAYGTYSTAGLPAVFGIKANASGNDVYDGTTSKRHGAEVAASNSQYFFNLGAYNNGTNVTAGNWAGNLYGVIVSASDMSAAKYARCYRWLWNKGGGVM